MAHNRLFITSLTLHAPIQKIGFYSIKLIFDQACSRPLALFDEELDAL